MTVDARVEDLLRELAPRVLGMLVRRHWGPRGLLVLQIVWTRSAPLRAELLHVLMLPVAKWLPESLRGSSASLDTFFRGMKLAA